MYVFSYPMSEIKRIQAQAKNHGLNAAITHAREKLYRLTNQPHTSDVNTLKLVFFWNLLLTGTSSNYPFDIHLCSDFLIRTTFVSSVSYVHPCCGSRQLLDEHRHKLTQTRDRTAELTSRYLSPLVQELGKLQANKILRGDYDLKIARQDYFVSKQDQVSL